MSSPARPLIRKQGITVQRVGNEVLLYDEQSHEAFCLNGTSAAVWDLCDGRNTITEISRSASLQLGTPVTEAVVEFALADLRGKGLLEATAEAATVPAGVSRRAMMQSLGASSLLLLPAIAVLATPKAAQAYGGCFNCASSQGGAAAQRRMQAQAAAAANQRKLQQLNSNKLGQ